MPKRIFTSECASAAVSHRWLATFARLGAVVPFGAPGPTEGDALRGLLALVSRCGTDEDIKAIMENARG